MQIISDAPIVWLRDADGDWFRCFDMARELLPKESRQVRDSAMALFRQRHPSLSRKIDNVGKHRRGYYIHEDNHDALINFLQRPEAVGEAEGYSRAMGAYNAGRLVNKIDHLLKVGDEALHFTNKTFEAGIERIRSILEEKDRQIATLTAELAAKQAPAAPMAQVMPFTRIKPRVRIPAGRKVA